MVADTVFGVANNALVAGTTLGLMIAFDWRLTLVALVMIPLSAIRAADLILVLDRGRLVDHGTHTELLERGGPYASLYERQFRSTSEPRLRSAAGAPA